ncbi:hypothetical protein BVC80_9033g79 [Macleaya cordata]|uniref:Transmembrane protein n=1 Tax=Macleaya cordata TaxID=56857 RepID=A0A200QYR7_MACCD|nr:hypothetical protein BVC80_9033g79 [Macleaya cordata]
MAASSISLLHPPPPPPPLSSNFFKPSFRSSLKPCNPSLHLSSPLISFTIPNSNRTIFHPHPPHKKTQIWRLRATSEEVLNPSDQVETIQQITSSGDTGVSVIISVLLFIAFVGLSILTIGVIYIAVTDFLTKREREKFEKEESEKKKKKGGKKGVVRSRSGPRGFGQQIDEDDFDD